MKLSGQKPSIFFAILTLNLRAFGKHQPTKPKPKNIKQNIGTMDRQNQVRLMEKRQMVFH